MNKRSRNHHDWLIIRLDIVVIHRPLEIVQYVSVEILFHFRISLSLYSYVSQ